MSDALHETQSLELRDASGRVLGSFVAGRAVAEVTAERDQLRAEVERLKTELEAARREVADKTAIEAERNQYRKALSDLLKEDLSFTDEELLDLEQNGMTLEEVIEELERKNPT
jgi:hypothetical protein